MARTETEIVVAESARVTALQREGRGLLARVQVLAVVDADTYVQVVELAKQCRVRQKVVHEFMDPLCEAAFRAHKIATASRSELLAPYEQGAQIADTKAIAWDTEQARLRQEAEAAARREQERLEAEARLKALAEEARLLREAEDHRLEAAAEAEARGDAETATRLLEAPIEISPVVPQPVFVPPVEVAPSPKLEGYGFRLVWKAELVDMGSLVRAAASGDRAALSFLSFNQGAADGVARSTRGTLAVPGVRFAQSKTAAGRV